MRVSTARAHPAPFSPTESAVVVVVVKVDTVPPGESARGTSPATELCPDMGMLAELEDGERTVGAGGRTPWGGSKRESESEA